MANEALKPCPFCGGSPRVARKSGVTGVACRSRYYRETVACKCGASSKEHKAPGRAVEAWNRRAALSSDDVAGGEPVAFIKRDGNKSGIMPTEKMYRLPDGEPLYTAPPELDQLRDRVKELEKALEPFANEAAQWTEYEDDEPLVEMWENCPDSALTVGMLRTARRVREGGKVE